VDAIYESTGHVCGWRDGEVLFRIDGHPVAFLGDGSIYSFRDGRVVGWLVDGNYRDRAGDIVAFESGADGGPMKPMLAVRPMQPMREMLPMRPMRQMAPMRPMLSTSWSRHSWMDWLG
jgi:hypothetical protein